MGFYILLHQARAPYPGFCFDPWQAEIATMNHSAKNLAVLVDGLGGLIVAAFRGIGAAVHTLRTACPVEIAPVQVPRPAQMPEAHNAVERAAA